MLTTIFARRAAAAVFGLSLACGAAPLAASADVPGPHPAYVHALHDLRYARFLVARPSYGNVDRFEGAAVREIDRSLFAVRQAAIDDGKDIYALEPTDVNSTSACAARSSCCAARATTSRTTSSRIPLRSVGVTARTVTSTPRSTTCAALCGRSSPTSTDDRTPPGRSHLELARRNSDVDLLVREVLVFDQLRALVAEVLHGKMGRA